MHGRLHIWREILHPLWRWIVLIPFAILGLVDTIRDDLVGSTNPAFHLGYWLPRWSWQTYSLIVAGLVIILTFEGAYRAIIKRDDMLRDIFAPEQTVARLVELQAEGKKLYDDTSLSPDGYIARLKQWQAEVEKVLSDNFSVSELHTFRTRGFYAGSQFTVNAPKEWADATEQQRIETTARIYALHHVIEYSGSQFFGPRIKAAEWLEDRHGT